MKTFEQFIKEMAGAGAIYTGKKLPDAQWWGCPQIYHKKKKKKKK